MPVYTLNIPKNLTVVSYNKVEPKSQQISIGAPKKEQELGL